MFASQSVLIAFISVLTIAVEIYTPATVPNGASIQLPAGFVAFSIELGFLPDFTGTKDHVNSLSENLLGQLGDFSGDGRPIIRVGGSSQDRAQYDPDLKSPTSLAGNGDIPSTVTIGPSFFECFEIFSDTKWIYGLNLKKTIQSDGYFQNLLDTISASCDSLSGRLLAWEYGNEPNLYDDSFTPETYTEAWLEGTRAISELLENHCVSLAGIGYLTPSVSSLSSTKVNIPDVLDAGLNDGDSIAFLGTHNYMADSDRDDVTINSHMMNHEKTVAAIDRHTSLLDKIDDPSYFYSISETNSLFGQGKAGVSNTFGAALWTLDFSLYSAAVNISRLNFHMGLDYRYSAWQPADTDEIPKGTKAPYYGNVAAAAILGTANQHKVQVAHLPITSNNENGRKAAYAIYHDEKLAKVVGINFDSYNFTVSGVATDSEMNNKSRGSVPFSFNIGSAYDERIGTIRQLIAPGQESITGITWDGYTFNYDVSDGKAVRLSNITVETTVSVSGGIAQIYIPSASAIVIDF